mmetsp:Transcript_3722/g.11527  ORF Transcript_3722/g.11527 Transcript_3722/m.11527 type:complete len:211 (+) Transcript_3722:920-1552(+)
MGSPQDVSRPRGRRGRDVADGRVEGRVGRGGESVVGSVGADGLRALRRRRRRRRRGRGAAPESDAPPDLGGLRGGGPPAEAVRASVGTAGRETSARAQGDVRRRRETRRARVASSKTRDERRRTRHGRRVGGRPSGRGAAAGETVRGHRGELGQGRGVARVGGPREDVQEEAPRARGAARGVRALRGGVGGLLADGRVRARRPRGGRRRL